MAILERNITENGEQVKKRFSELQNMIDKNVFYNGEYYTVKEVGKIVNPEDFEYTEIVFLQPTKPINVRGDDILNIKNVVLSKKTIHHKDGTMDMKFEKIPHEGQSINEQGVVDLGEIYE